MLAHFPVSVCLLRAECMMHRRRMVPTPSLESFSDKLGTKIINVHIGDERKHFCVHQHLLRTKCPVLEEVLSAKASTGESEYNPDDVFLISFDADAFSLLMEWLYTGSIQSPNSRLSHVALRSSIESHISLHILAEEYKIKDLADSAMDYIGICYSLMGALPSKAEIHHALNKSPISSRLREYMSNSFLHILSAPSYTTEVGDVHSTGELWLLAKTHDDLGEYAFGYLRDGDTNRSPPKYDFLCDYRSHSKNSSCAVRGKLFIHYVESNHDEPLSVSSSPLTFSTPRDSLIEPLERRAPNEQNGFKDVIPLQAFIAASTSASIGTITTPNASANESKIATPSASRPQNTNAIGRIYTPSSGKHPRPAIESLAAEMQVWK